MMKKIQSLYHNVMLVGAALLLCLVVAAALAPLSARAQVATPPPPAPAPTQRYQRTEPKNPLHAGDPAQYVFFILPIVVGVSIAGVVLWNRARRPPYPAEQGEFGSQS